MLLPALLLVAACGDDALTEVVIVVNSDLDVPFEIDGLRVTVSRGGDALQAVGGLGPGQPPFPRSVSVVNDSPSLGPFEARVQLTRGGATVVERLARFTFEAGARRRLDLVVPGACIDIDCESDETCGPLCDTNVVGCQDPAVDLAPFASSGLPLRAEPSLDAGVP